MKLVKDGPKFNKDRYELILSLRRQKKSEGEIAKLLGITRQGVSYYLCKYGDIDRVVDK